MNHAYRYTAVVLSVTAVLIAVPAHADPSGGLTDLVDAAAQRLQIADPVAASKWLTGGSITDPARAQQVIDAVAAEAQSDGVASDYVKQVFVDQINATEGIQYSRFAGWKFDVSTAPTSAPDLTASRSLIDGLNSKMVDQIVAQWPLLHSHECSAELDAAKSSVAAAHQFDSLMRQALDSATDSYCPA